MRGCRPPACLPPTAGDKGENFYVVERGRFDIIVNGKKVADFGEGTPNMSFGELALLYNSPRAATVQATTTCKLWSLDRVTFRGVVAKAAHAQHNRLKTTLRRGILEDLTDEQIGKVAA
jgi:CRP-like cAMP-binding protein